jgi:hypothetical protein
MRDFVAPANAEITGAALIHPHVPAQRVAGQDLPASPASSPASEAMAITLAVSEIERPPRNTPGTGPAYRCPGCGLASR